MEPSGKREIPWSWSPQMRSAQVFSISLCTGGVMEMDLPSSCSCLPIELASSN